MQDTALYLIDLFGTGIFAISGVLVAGRLKMDPFGMVVLAGATAIGGGTLRDILLDATPVFWMLDSNYLWIIVLSCLGTVLFLKRERQLPRKLLPICDAIGLAVFVGIAVDKATVLGSSATTAVIMGVISGCGGGIIRDILARRMPMLLRSEIYATACLIGGVLHMLALHLQLSSTQAMFIGMASTLSIRLAAIQWHLKLPIFKIDKCPAAEK